MKTNILFVALLAVACGQVGQTQSVSADMEATAPGEGGRRLLPEGEGPGGTDSAKWEVLSHRPDRDWQLIADKFCFHLPASFGEDKIHPTDSYVRQFSSDEAVIIFDYGIYSGVTDSVNVWVDSVAAEFTANPLVSEFGKLKTEFLFSLSFDKVNEREANLSIHYYGKDESHRGIARRIFGTVELNENCGQQQSVVSSAPYGPVCDYYGKSLSPGMSIPSLSSCNTCTCEDGVVLCTEIYCPLSPWDLSLKDISYRPEDNLIEAVATYGSCTEQEFELEIIEDSCTGSPRACLATIRLVDFRGYEYCERSLSHRIRLDVDSSIEADELILIADESQEIATVPLIAAE